MITDKQMCEAYYEATTQELRPQDRRLVRQYTDVLETIVTQGKGNVVGELESKLLELRSDNLMMKKCISELEEVVSKYKITNDFLHTDNESLKESLALAQDIIDTEPKPQQVEQSRTDDLTNAHSAGFSEGLRQGRAEAARDVEQSQALSQSSDAQRLDYLDSASQEGNYSATVWAAWEGGEHSLRDAIDAAMAKEPTNG